MLLGIEHRRFVRDKMRLLVVKTALKSEFGKVRSGVLETVEKSTMAVDRAVPITMINFFSADFDRRWLDQKRFVSRIDCCVDLENWTRICCFAPLRVFPSARKVCTPAQVARSIFRDGVGSRRVMARQNPYNQGNRSPYQTLESDLNSSRNPPFTLGRRRHLIGRR